ncbi:hypothetical protein E6C70_10145 [Glaciibacter flavus]|uniref:Uncharacterized protein n=1 Tax=Orlajensenia flava TaxID=2565934 RepID=A0A4V3WU36_9MICO|nr:hypothetical protein E6C70_10145 [Glaciibacter flavus]
MDVALGGYTSPNESVCVAPNGCDPAASPEAVQLHRPAASAVVVQTVVPVAESTRVTVLPGTAVPFTAAAVWLDTVPDAGAVMVGAGITHWKTTAPAPPACPVPELFPPMPTYGAKP